MSSNWLFNFDVIEKGDTVKFSDDYISKQGKVFRVTDVKTMKCYYSGIGVQVEGTKTYYDSGWFEIVDKLMPLKFNL